MKPDACGAPVFVIGSPRSGTTLLYHLLLSSDGFAEYHAEANVFNLLAPRFGNLASARNREALLNVWLRSEYFKRSGLDPGEFRILVHQRCRSAGDLLRLLMEGVARRQGVHRWAECTPENLLYVPQIAAAFPNARFVHIVRDGRDVACSMAEQGWVGPRDADWPTRVLHSGLYWDWMVGRGRKHLAARGIASLQIRFESLVGEPEKTLAQVAGFIEHDLDYDRINANRVGAAARPNTSFPDDASGSFNPVGRWERLERPVLARLEAAIGERVTQLGYSLQTSPAERAEQALVAVRARRLAILRYSSRLFLKSRTPLGRLFTNPALLTDFHAFDRERLLPAQRKS